jgi:hypothetical protein
MSIKVSLLLAGAAVSALPADDFLTWDAKRANSILSAQRVSGDVGRNLDFRVVRTDRSVNYKLRATWLTPDAVRAAARLEQIAKSLSQEETRRLVAEAERAGDTVIMVELDPREGSGVIPSDWIATFGARNGEKRFGGAEGVRPEGLRVRGFLAGISAATRRRRAVVRRRRSRGRVDRAHLREGRPGPVADTGLDPDQTRGYFALSRFANSLYAPGTPAGNWRNQLYDVKI